MEENNKKICKNCKYFCAYYLKKQRRFITIGYGHCSSRKDKKYPAYNNTYPNNYCIFWERITEKSETNVENIKTVLQNMHEKLIEIENLLKNE